MAQPDLAALQRGHASRTSGSGVERPPSRLLTRLALPAVIVLSALGMLAYAARETFRPAIDVMVAPVVPGTSSGTVVAASAGSGSGEVVQAPGWIEADPNAYSVAALEEGVVKELMVLDGAKVETGQVVATLIDDEAVLAKRQADAEVQRTAAAVLEADAAAAAAESSVAAEQAKMEEARDTYRRVEGLGGQGLMSDEEIAARRLRLASMAAAVEAARSAAGTAKASVARAKAEQELARVAADRAALTLSRMRVISPRGGVVLQRMVEPGQRLMRDANNMFAGVVVRLYDPAHLQVRVDVPLVDAAKVREGDSVEVSTETLPGRTFKGTLTRFVHEANLQKNTVQVKVSLADPAPELKPDMLTKARIATRRSGVGSGTTPAAGSQGPLVAPRQALFDATETTASVWLLQRETSTVVRRAIKLGAGGGGVTDTGVEVLEGLRLGDRVVINPPAGLADGMKVNAMEGGMHEHRH